MTAIVGKYVLLISILILSSSFLGHASNQILNEDRLSFDQTDFEFPEHDFVDKIQVSHSYPKIAFVKPVFTATAYASFYSCYSPSNTNYQGCFRQQLVDTWGTSRGTPNIISTLIGDGYPASKIIIISDVEVHTGEIFDVQGIPLYSTIIFSHNEYVTLPEYHNMVRFIKAGGNVIIMNGNAFFAEVDYDPLTSTVYLVSGHGWSFDGENGSRSDVYRSRFRNGINNNEHFNWIGSVYYHFNAGNINGAVFDLVNNTNPHPISTEMLRLGYSRIATSYRSHEDNELITPNAHIIADWDATFTERARGIKIYEKFPEGPYGGSLIHFGIFGSDYFAGSYASRVALVQAIFHQAGYLDSPWIRYPYDGAVLNRKVILDFSDKWQTSVYLDGSSTLLTKGADLSYLAEGNHTIEVDFMINDVIHRREVSFVIDRTPPSFRFNGNTSLNLPDDLTITPLLISMVDDNSEVMKLIRNHEDIPYSDLFQATMKGDQLTDTYSGSYSAKYLILEGYDSAGNQNLTVVPYNTSATIADLPKYMQPSHTRVNLTTLRVDIPIISDTMTAYLDISDNYGVTWTKYEFTEYNSSSNLQSAYYNRGKASIWYRVGVINNGSTLYYRNIKSYQWDTTIPILQYHNLSSYPNADNPFEIDFRLSQYQNMNVTLHYFDQSNEVVFTGVTTSYSSTNLKVLGKIPTLEDGFYKLVIVLNSGFSNTSFIIPIQIQQKFVSEPIKNYSVSVFETFQINLQNLAGEVKLWTAVIQEEDKILLAVSSEYLTSIILNFQTVRNLTLSVISNGGKLIKVFSIESILDTSAPEIIGQGLVSYFEELQHSKFVNWTLNDQSGGFYALYLDSIIILSGEWTDGSNVGVDTQDFQIGSYNLTFHARDYYGNELVFTTLLHIHPGIPEPPESLVETDTTILSVNNSSLSQTTNPSSSELSDPLSTSLDKSTNGDSNYMPGWLVVATLGVVPSYRLFLRKMKMKR